MKSGKSYQKTCFFDSRFILYHFVSYSVVFCPVTSIIVISFFKKVNEIRPTFHYIIRHLSEYFEARKSLARVHFIIIIEIL